MRSWIRKHWKLTVLALVLLFGGCSFGMLEYTHEPRFCVSCHVMKPFYAAWESSSHNNVGCVDCHYPPGLQYEIQGKLDALNQVVAFWTGSYNTKFYAEIQDQSCLRSGCHDSRLLDGPIEFKRGIKFDHAGHYGQPMRGIQLRCTSCHSQIVQGNHMAVTEVTCFICHFRNRVSGTKPLPQQFCLTCHDYPKADIQLGDHMYNHALYVERGVDCQRCHIDTVQGNGEVEDRACLQCHDDPDQIKKITEVEQVHLNHVTNHKVECFECHADIIHRVNKQREEQALNCNKCHADTHVGPKELYAGVGGYGVEPMPAPMFKAQVDCVACHLDEETYGSRHAMSGTTMRPTIQGCIDCHGESGGDILALWRQSVRDAVASGQAAVDRAKGVLERTPATHEGYVRAQQLLEHAQFNIDFVNYGKGIHNVEYSLALIDKAREYSEIAIGLLK